MTRGPAAVSRPPRPSRPAINGDSCKPPVSPQPGVSAPAGDRDLQRPRQLRTLTAGTAETQTAAQVRAEKLAKALKALPQGQASKATTCEGGTEEVRDKGLRPRRGREDDDHSRRATGTVEACKRSGGAQRAARE